MAAVSSETLTIGSILLDESIQDFYPYLEECVNTYNRSKKEPPPQTITGGDGSGRGETSIISEG